MYIFFNFRVSLIFSILFSIEIWNIIKKSFATLNNSISTYDPHSCIQLCIIYVRVGLMVIVGHNYCVTLNFISVILLLLFLFYLIITKIY